MDILTQIVESDIFQIIFKVLLSSFLAGIIGIERSSMNKPAGFGTHAIIGLSSALVVMASQYMSIHYDIDASRIPSQILAGIGFIGAGTIIRNGINVRGVTTAAGILSVTCIGIAVGIGYYEAAIISTLVVFLILSVNHEIAGKFERFENIELSITVSSNVTKTIEEIQDLFKKEKVVIKSIKKETDVIEDKKTEVIRLCASYDIKETTKNELISSLISIKSILEVMED